MKHDDYLEPRHLCAACGRTADEHALCLNDDGVVTAGSWRKEDDFSICADPTEHLRQLRRELQSARDLGAWHKMLDGVRDIISRYEQHHPSEFGQIGTQVLYDLRMPLGRHAPDHLPPIGVWKPLENPKGKKP